MVWLSEMLLPVLSACFLLLASSSFNAVDAEGPDSSIKTTSQVSGAAAAGKPTSGYPQLFTRKTASLLAEALHMLSRVKDVKERRWLETFVHRLATLADGLDHASDQSSRVSATQSKDQLQKMVTQKLKESKVGLEQELQSQPSGDGQVRRMLTTNKSPKDDPTKNREDKLRLDKQREIERTRLLKNIFAEIQLLRELGGKTQDVFEILKRGMGVAEGQVRWPSSTAVPTARTATNDPEPAHTTAVAREQQAFARPLPGGDLAKQLEEEKLVLVTEDYDLVQ